MRLTVFVTAAALLGCENPQDNWYVRYEPVCQPSAEQQEWVVKCIENANPKSDEEPEDWIPICNRMSEGLFCPSLGSCTRRRRVQACRVI